MNYIWAFDPGSVATGVACVHPQNQEFALFEQFPDVKDAWHYFETQCATTDTALVEMYRSAGYLTQHAQRTIEAVGFLKNAYEYYFGNPILVVTEQARLSGQRQAAELMGDAIDTLRSDPLRKDAFSALSHCCAYRRRLHGV